MSNSLNICEYTWNEVRDSVTKVKPEFSKIIDEWDPGKEYTFIELSYPFGSHILDTRKGGFQIPLENGLTASLADPSVPTSLRDALAYSSLPLGIVIDGGVEVYHKLQERIFSLAYFSSGLNLGIWESFAPPTPFSVISGPRSLFMAPKITDTDSHKKIKKEFGIRHPAPRNLFDHWLIFSELAKHAKDPWKVKILFLTKKWTEPQKNNAGWLRFQNFLLKRAWDHTEYARSKSLFEVSWENFCNTLQNKGERFDPYLIETLRHIIFMGQGALPAFAAVGNNKVYGPTQFFIETYLHVYGLKNYVPTLLGPAHFGKGCHKNSHIYYSFQNPTLIESIPKNKTFSSAIDDMRNFKVLMEYFLEEVSSNNLVLGNNQLLEMLNSIQFDYFHSEMHTYGGIRPSSDLSKEDENLIFMPDGNTNRMFADKGSFFRCCLRLSPSQKGKP